MDGDLVLFYELEGFKQNHRRYKPSFASQHGQTPGLAVPQFGLFALLGTRLWVLGQATGRAAAAPGARASHCPRRSG